MSFTIGSLFDGSGGFPLAATMCGGTPLWASEVEPFPIAVTWSRFPDMKHLGSVTDVKGDKVEPVDVITFGSPCQDLSVAGKRAGLKHEDNGDDETTRSGLFMEAVRIIKEMRKATNGVYPRFAIWENVPGAFSSNKGEDFRTVCEELIKICEPGAVMPAVPKNGWPYADYYCGEGWSLAYRVYDAQYWGVPQRRRRIYLVFDLTGERAGKISFEREGVRGYFTEGRTPWKGIAPNAQGCPGTDDREGESIITYGWPLGFRPENVNLYEEKATTLCNGTRPGFTTGIVCVATQQGGAEIRTDDKAPTVTAAAGMSGNNQPVVCYGALASSAVNAEITDGKISPCLMARAGTGGNQLPLVAVYDARGNGDGQTVNTLIGDHNNRITDYSTLVCEPAGTFQNTGAGWWNETPVGATLRTPCGGDATLANVVAFQTYQKVTGPLMANSHPGSYTGQDAFSDMLVAGVDCRNMNESPELYPTLQAKSNGGQSLNYSGAVRIRYIVRRLTPTECARLQGFADRWAVPISKDDFTAEEYAFWHNVRKTHTAIQADAEIEAAKSVIQAEKEKAHPNPGMIEKQQKIIANAEARKQKDYTKEQMLTWYNKLHTDSSEYKLWGNGIALPTALYVMQGISDAINQ